ncbi:TPA: DUF551 domain-containing protein [Klebsiella quasipneumoniae subsp. similipneumoniae]|nr:DUF551 domain-containing protein [Klebsiella quasipneumoniae subsp. similipneumoniae]
MTSKLTRLTDDELTETLRLATSGYPLPAWVEGNLRQAFAELQERRKADSEPVAWTDEEELRDVNVAGIGYLFGIDQEANKFADPRRQIMLYRHAQPAPVVPEEATTENIQVISGALIPRNGGWYKMDENECHMAVDVWNACRAAMLQAGNSPVIPDGYRLQPISEYEAMCATVNSDEWPQRWIPVSERMPEDRTQVILWDAEIGEVISGHYSHKTHTFYHCGDAIQNEITHWMPLPAAPQEVK